MSTSTPGSARRPLRPAPHLLQPASRPLRPARRRKALSRPFCSLRTASCGQVAAPCCCMPCSLRCPDFARPTCCAAMASLCVLAFNHEGRPIQFDTWLDDLQLYQLSDSRDSVLLFDHTTALALYDVVVARYSSPATTALGRLLLPYLFPELSAFATVEDLDSHLRNSDARYRDALPTEFLAKNPPPMYITLYFIVTRLPDSLRAVRDHFLALEPIVLTVDLLEQHLLAAETSVITVGAARGTPRTPFFEGSSPSPLAPSYAIAAAFDVLGAENVRVASASEKHRSSKGKGDKGGGGGSGGGGGGSSGGGGGGGSGGGSGGFSGGGGGNGGSSTTPTAALQDAMVTTTTPGGQRVSICTCTRTGRHLATFKRWPGSSLYTLATELPHVAASAQVAASGPVPPPSSCRLLSHQTLLWHHRLGHPSLRRLRGMHSRLLVSGLPRSLPPLLPLPALPCLPCVEGRLRATPQSSSFPLTTAPLQTLHMDVWGPARVSGQSRERYFLLVVDDYTWYTTVFPLCSKGEVIDVLIPWIRAGCLQLR
ncbi:unnamed protein product [Closterium sp. NIES-53]